MKPSKNAIMMTILAPERRPTNSRTPWQMSRDGEGIAVRRNRPRGHGEPSQHPGMVVANLLEEVVADDRVRLRRRDGEIGGGHPVDEVALEHRV